MGIPQLAKLFIKGKGLCYMEVTYRILLLEWIDVFIKM